jgi:hypothetical protein
MINLDDPEAVALADKMMDVLEPVVVGQPMDRTAAAITRVCAVVLRMCAQDGDEGNVLRSGAAALQAAAKRAAKSKS